MLIAEEYESFRKGTNKWDTLSAQIKYLSDRERNVQQSLF